MQLSHALGSLLIATHRYRGFRQYMIINYALWTLCVDEGLPPCLHIDYILAQALKLSVGAATEGVQPRIKIGVSKQWPLNSSLNPKA